MAVAVPLVLGRIIGWALGALAFKLIAAAGVGIVTFIGVQELLDSAKAEIMSLTTGLGTYVAQAVVMMRIDDAVVVIFSAMSARVALKALGPGGAIGSFFLRPPVA